MGHLMGLKDYLGAGYHRSVFDQAVISQQLWELHLHAHRVIRARITANQTYDVTAESADQGIVALPKIQVKLLYPAEISEAVTKLVKMDTKVRALGLSPISSHKSRYFVKNKTLFPLMQERQVVFFTLLEGETLRGLVTEFSQYEITVHLKGGLPVVILRHGIYDARDKQGRCLLKSFQNAHKDWQKSALFVS